MSNFLQMLCPECGEKAVSVERVYPSTRTCPNGHTWIPIKNPEPIEADE